MYDLHNAVGIVPVNLLLDRYMLWIALNAIKDEGMVPTNELCERYSEVRDEHCPIEVGIDP